MKQFALITFAFIFILVSCAPVATIVPTQTAIPTSTLMPVPSTITPTATVMATEEPKAQINGLSEADAPTVEFINEVISQYVAAENAVLPQDKQITYEQVIANLKSVDQADGSKLILTQDDHPIAAFTKDYGWSQWVLKPIAGVKNIRFGFQYVPYFSNNQDYSSAIFKNSNAIIVDGEFGLGSHLLGDYHNASDNQLSSALRNIIDQFKKLWNTRSVRSTDCQV